jgi:hypothetical protein
MPSVNRCCDFLRLFCLQEAYFEEALKLPNALSLLAVKPRTRKPLVVLGLREHIFTHSLSASAFFMSQQEYLFGTMWQRAWRWWRRPRRP